MGERKGLETQIHIYQSSWSSRAMLKRERSPDASMLNKGEINHDDAFALLNLGLLMVEKQPQIASVVAD